MTRRQVSRRGVLTAGAALVGAPLAALGAPLAVGGPGHAATPAAAAGTNPVPAGSAASAGTGPAPTGVDPATALERLLAGNRRFSQGRSRHPRQDVTALRRLATGQRPYAVVLGCADSRVAPELIFDQGLGDLFDNRLAGNIVDDLVLASVEYAVETFASPLLVVLGHERCGAVTATIDAIEADRAASRSRSTNPIVDALRPIVAPALRLPGDPVENAVRANIRAQSHRLSTRSPLVARRVRQGELLVVGARYDLDHGRVTVLDRGRNVTPSAVGI